MADRVEPLAGERQPGESNKAVQACNDYLRLGPGRSLVLLIQKFNTSQVNSAPTHSKQTLEQWSSRFTWADRAATYDKRLEEEKNLRAKEIMDSGLALDYERVVKLKKMADFLEAQVYAQAPIIITTTPQADSDSENAGEATSFTVGSTYPNIWVHDVKSIGQGAGAQRVDIYRFNSAILDQYRGVLDDLAKETGGRISKHEMTGKNGGPIELNDEQHDRTVSALAQALGALISTGGTGEANPLGSAESAAVDGAADESV
jgi:hypothetical protein